jgi:hypothetical protein
MVMSIITHDDHVTVIERRVRGKHVDSCLLWEAVAYFLMGKGKNLPKPCTEEEWAKLLKETNHEEYVKDS